MRIDSNLRMLVFIVTISLPAFLLAESPAEVEAAVESALADYRAAWLEGSEEKVMYASPAIPHSIGIRSTRARSSIRKLPAAST